MKVARNRKNCYLNIKVTKYLTIYYLLNNIQLITYKYKQLINGLLKIVRKVVASCWFHDFISFCNKSTMLLR